MKVNCHYNSSKFDSCMSLKKVAALLLVCAFVRATSRTNDTVKSSINFFHERITRSKPKKGHNTEIQLQFVQILHDGGIRHVKKYAPDDGLVRESVYETRQGFVWTKRMNKYMETEEGP